MDLRYNAACDSAYILLEYGHIVSTRRLPGLRRMVDYDGLGRPLGIILHHARQGVDLEGLPFPDEIAALLQRYDVPVHRSTPAALPPIRLRFVRRRVAPGVDGAVEHGPDSHRHTSAA